jgi:hypothetical protein
MFVIPNPATVAVAVLIKNLLVGMGSEFMGLHMKGYAGKLMIFQKALNIQIMTIFIQKTSNSI